MKKSILSTITAVALICSASAQVPTGDLANGLIADYKFNGVLMMPLEIYLQQ
jgi:hypothetical protein